MLDGILTPYGEEVEWEDALERAARGDIDIPWSYSLISAMKKGSENRYPISASQFGLCLRQSLLKRTVSFFEPAGSHIPMLMGTWAHQLVEENPHPRTQAEVELFAYTDDGVKVTGVIDDLRQRTDGRWGIIDAKTTRWLNPDKVPYGSHATQVNVYRWLAEGNDYTIADLAIEYYDLTGPARNHKHEGMVHAPIELWDWTKLNLFVNHRANILQAAHFPPDGEEAVMPEMVSPSERWVCKYCPANVKAECDRIGE
jgi:hypothetical protein